MKILIISQNQDYYGELIRQFFPNFKIILKNTNEEFDTDDHSMVICDLKANVDLKGEKIWNISSQISAEELISKISYFNNSKFHFVDCTFNYINGKITGKEFVIQLSEKESQILKFLIELNGEFSTKDEILQRIWGYNNIIDTQTLSSCIYRLKQKIRKIKSITINHKDKSGYQAITKTLQLLQKYPKP